MSRYNLAPYDLMWFEVWGYARSEIGRWSSNSSFLKNFISVPSAFLLNVRIEIGVLDIRCVRVAKLTSSSRSDTLYVLTMKIATAVSLVLDTHLIKSWYF